MQLRDAIQDFMLEYKVRRLVPRTIDNYGKHLRYLTDYLTAEYQIEKLEEVKSAHIKKFLLMKEEQGCKPHYINDLLKVFKTFFRYCTEEEYIKSNPAKRVHNVRQPKVMIRTFSEDEILKMLNHYQGNDFISVRNKAMLEKAANMIQTEQLVMPDDWYYIAFFHEDRIIEAAGPEGGIYLHREQAEQYCVLTVKESGKIAYREYFHHSQDAYAYFIEELRYMARSYRSVPKQSSNTSKLSSYLKR